MEQRLLEINESISAVIDKFLSSSSPVSKICLYDWYECGSNVAQSHKEMLTTYYDAIKEITTKFGTPEYNGSGPSGGGITENIDTNDFEIDLRAEAFCFWRLPGKLIKLELSAHDARTMVDITMTVIDIEGRKHLVEKNIKANAKFAEEWRRKNANMWWKFW